VPGAGGGGVGVVWGGAGGWLGGGGGGGGGAESELVDLYTKACKKGCSYHKVSDSVYVSPVELSLSDYIKGRQLYCSDSHKHPCIKCERMLHVAQLVHTEGYCSLSHAFSIVSPGVK